MTRKTEPNAYLWNHKTVVIGNIDDDGIVRYDPDSDYAKELRTTMEQSVQNAINEAVQASPFVDKYYQSNWGMEDLLFDGRELRDGMVILLADPQMRYDATNVELAGPGVLDSLMVRNRWCRISRVTVDNENRVHFLATYDDGMKRKRSYGVVNSWLAKKTTLFAHEGHAHGSYDPEPIFDEARSEYDHQWILDAFGYHPPKDDIQVEKHKMLRREFISFAKFLTARLQDGYKKHVVLEKLEECAMMAHKSVALESPVDIT